MKVAAEILVAPGRGYVLRLHAAAPPGFPDDFRVVLEELSYYDGNDDVLLVVEAAELSGRITGLDGPRDYEVSFAGTLNFALADGQLGTFLELNSERGVDYTHPLGVRRSEAGMLSERALIFLCSSSMKPAATRARYFEMSTIGVGTPSQGCVMTEQSIWVKSS